MNQITRMLPFFKGGSDESTHPEPTYKLAVGRRGFLTAGAAFGGGLVIGASLTRQARAATATSTVNVFFVIGTDNTVQIVTPGGEMGQGINSGLAQIMSEELPLNWANVTTVPAPFGAQYGRGATHSQVTGGSFNTRGWFTLMLQAGATAREMLLAAARQTFPSAPTPLKAVNGAVQDANGVQLATYGALAQTASGITLSSAAPILSATNGYKVVGTNVLRPDIRLKVDGSAVFGIDVRLPGMKYASVRHGPVWGATVKTMGSAPAGETAVNLTNAVAVTGPNTWKAIQNARGLSVSWNTPTSSVLGLADSATLATNAATLMTSGTPAVAETVGDINAGFTAATTKLDMTFTLPYLAHSCMEVLNCTVSVTRDAGGTPTACQVWCPTQAPDWVANTVLAQIPNLTAAQVTVTTTYMGGGLGRKIEQDYVIQAIKTALAVKAPVKLVWSREEDFNRDWYRPAARSRVQVGLDAAGNITAWNNRIVAPSLTRSHGGVPRNGLDGIAIGEAVGVPYAMTSRYVDYVEQPSGIQIGYWRSVGESISCFVVESTIDQCARSAGIDPYLYRRRLLAGKTSMLAVLDQAAALAGWSTPPAAGHARGIALSPGFGSMAAVVAELALTSTGAVQVVSLSCAVDCGMAVNPGQVVRQIEGGLMHGMNSALWHKVTFSRGVTGVRNFPNYPVAQMKTTPKINVAIVSQGSPLGGIGEVGVPGVAPALANAYAALTGTRKYDLPLGIVTAPVLGD